MLRPPPPHLPTAGFLETSFGRDYFKSNKERLHPSLYYLLRVSKSSNKCPTSDPGTPQWPHSPIIWAMNNLFAWCCCCGGARGSKAVVGQERCPCCSQTTLFNPKCPRLSPTVPKSHRNTKSSFMGSMDVTVWADEMARLLGLLITKGTILAKCLEGTTSASAPVKRGDDVILMGS